MRTKLPSSELFLSHRTQLVASFEPNSLAILPSNAIQEMNADAAHPFRQSSDLFYLTGISQEDTLLILFPEAKLPRDREILFLKETNETIAIWEGAKLSKKEATERTGIQRVEWLSQLERVLNELVPQAEILYLCTNEHSRRDTSYEGRALRFVKECKARFPLHQYRRLAPLIYALRAVKSPEEVEFIQEACHITEAGFRRLLGFVRPGIGEWEVEAELIHEFIRRGSRGFAYSPIIASGCNSCILHYTSNDQILQDGQLLLLDVAAEYGGWNSDMTRTIPVSGKFTPRQRAVYDAVLAVMRYAATILKPGVSLPEYQKLVLSFMETQLIQLGLFTAEEAAEDGEEKRLTKKYFMHGTSHHLGLDVHDVSRPNQEVSAGMVFTIEPGIYIPEEEIGIRLENNYLIGETENIDLMASIPIEADEIEKLMSA